LQYDAVLTLQRETSEYQSEGVILGSTNSSVIYMILILKQQTDPPWNRWSANRNCLPWRVCSL